MGRMIRSAGMFLLVLGASSSAFAAGMVIAPDVPPLPPPRLAAKPAATSNQVSNQASNQLQSAAKLFSQPVLLRGTLGQRKIQMQLRPHAEFEGSVQGSYLEFGQSQKIALAGEYQGDALMMEESINGTNVSGSWSGSLKGNTYSGNWYAQDESNPVPFVLTVSEIAR